MFGIFENSEVESVFNDDHNEEEDTPEAEFMLNNNEVNPEFEEMERLMKIILRSQRKRILKINVMFVTNCFLIEVTSEDI